MIGVILYDREHERKKERKQFDVNIEAPIIQSVGTPIRPETHNQTYPERR